MNNTDWNWQKVDTHEIIEFQAGFIWSAIHNSIRKEIGKFHPQTQKILNFTLAYSVVWPFGSLVLLAPISAIVYKNKTKINDILMQWYIQWYH